LRFFKFVSIAAISLLYGFNCSSINDFKEYNGHYYTITKDKLTFLQAKQFAEDNGCYLAIPNDQAENDFLKSLIPTPKYAWIGIYDPQYTSNYCYNDVDCAFDDSRFVDIKGNPLTYVNWAEKQPDNLVKQYDIQNGKKMVSPLGEHWVAMSSLDGKWADFGNHFDEYNNPVKFYALIECDKMPDCYTPPSNVKDTWSGAKCNTKIYDNTTDEVITGQTYNCLKDPNGNYYCPAGLAPCGKTWTYEDGYSKKYNNTANITKTAQKQCPSGTIMYNGKCYLDKNHDGKITSADEALISVDYWTYTQHQDGRFYRYTEAYLRYPVKMSISWGGDDYHFGAKIKYNGRLVWSRLYFPGYRSCYTIGGEAECNCYAQGGIDIANVVWSSSSTSFLICKDMIGHGDFIVKSTEDMYGTTDWHQERNLANVVGNYFFIFFRDGGNYVANDYITINFYTHNPTPPFALAKPVNPKYCPSGYYQSGRYCYVNPVCPDGYQNIDGTCKKTVTVEYSYYEYLCSGTNEYNQPYKPQNPGGDCHPQSEKDLIDTNGDGIPDSCNSPTPPKNNCRALSFTCVPAPERKCVMVNNEWQCSPYPCFGEGEGDYDVTTDDTPVGIDDKKNDGWNSDGSCSGKIYIFNGQDMRCRSSDAFFGLTGGGCCDKDKVFLGLVRCKEEEKILAKKNQNEECHYIGEYCSKKLKLLVKKICVQHKKTYCCFNSKLARLIQEQGRQQLGISWGDAKHPNCRGFTPEEFQKLDFSKMDLSEYYDGLSQSLSPAIQQNINVYIKNKINTSLQQAQ